MASFVDDLVRHKGSPAIAYAADGLSSPRQTFVRYANYQAEHLMGVVRGDVIMATAPASDQIGTAAVLRLTDPPGGYATPQWYLVVKGLVGTRGRGFEPPGLLLLVRLPYLLAGQRVAPRPLRATLTGHVEPRAQLPGQGGYVSVPTVQTAVRAGFSQEYDPYTESAIGAIPMGLLTAYTPLLADIQLDDTFAINGLPWVVTQVNPRPAMGQFYGQTVIMSQGAGSGLAPTT